MTTLLCPYCRAPLGATDPECPGCRLNLARAKALLGAFPLFHPGVSDAECLLSEGDLRRIRRRMARLRERFSQVDLQVTLHRFPAEHPFSLYAFWVFNGSVLSGHASRGSGNHALLLLLDIDRREAALMPGYGLEPHLSAAALEELLHTAAAEWAASHWAAGILRVLDGLDSLLASAASVLRPARPQDGF